MPRALVIATVVLLASVCGLGLFAVHMKRTAERQAATTVDTTLPVAAPVPGITATVTLYVADDHDAALHARQVSMTLPADPQQRAKEILRGLLAQYAAPGSGHKVGAGGDVTDVFLVQDTAIVATNAPFADAHPSGMLVEQLTLASIARTLAANVASVKRVKLLIDGKERETLAGHAGLATLYDVHSATEPAQ